MSPHAHAQQLPYASRPSLPSQTPTWRLIALIGCEVALTTILPEIGSETHTELDSSAPEIAKVWPGTRFPRDFLTLSEESENGAGVRAGVGGL